MDIVYKIESKYKDKDGCWITSKNKKKEVMLLMEAVAIIKSLENEIGEIKTKFYGSPNIVEFPNRKVR